eukprot:scaffold8712_cov135-Skeletonema_dohrnii-CCMP3373.AAC.7
MKNHQGTSKQVTFSEASKLYTYHEDRPQRERLFYNKRDYDAFRENASTAAFHLRRQTEASLDDESCTLYETESWLPSPQILEEADASIEPEEVIGLEGSSGTDERYDFKCFDRDLIHCALQGEEHCKLFQLLERRGTCLQQYVHTFNY